jgi:hypothetical protein
MRHSMTGDKTARGNASQFFVAGELCRRGYAAVVTLGNTPNTDVLCSNHQGTSFAHIQVKTFVPGKRSCSVGMKAERPYGRGFFWILAGVPLPGSPDSFEYYVIPAADMARNVTAFHERWLATPGNKGQRHRDNKVRAVGVRTKGPDDLWNVAEYRDRWDLIANHLSDPAG